MASFRNVNNFFPFPNDTVDRQKLGIREKYNCTRPSLNRSLARFLRPVNAPFPRSYAIVNAVIFD